MAVVSGTMVTYGASGLVGQREDLEDIIYNITPKDTPFTSMIGSSPVSAVRHEWQIDTFATPTTSSAVEQGAEYEYEVPALTSRVSNLTQINRKTLVVSGTAEKVEKAGRASEIAYQMIKRGVEIKKDIELTCLTNQASVAAANGVAPKSAGFPAWFTTNDSRGSGGSDGGFNSGTGLVAAATAGTQRTFTKALMDTVMQAIYVAGGDASVMMVSPYAKKVFSNMLDDADTVTLRRQANGGSQASILAAADEYIGDFGTYSVVPNRVMATNAAVASNVFLIDTSKVTRGVLRPMMRDEPAKTGDATKKAMLTEWTLIVKNEAAHGVIADIFGLTAST